MGSANVQPVQNRRWLRAAARDLLGDYGIEAPRLRLLTDSWNCVFRVDAGKQGRYVLRISAKWGCHSVAETEAEFEWLRELVGIPALSVPRPVARRDGAFVSLIARELAPDHRQCVLFRWSPGRIVGNRIGSSTARRWGRCAALLHTHAKGYAPDRGEARRFDAVFPYANAGHEHPEPVMIPSQRLRDLVPRKGLAVCQQAIEDAQSIIDAVFACGEEPRLIHNDLHPWNLLVDRDRLSILDFEDLMWGYPIQDIATMFYYLRCQSASTVLEAAFREGYEEIADWPAADAVALNALIAARGLMLVNTLLNGERRQDRVAAEHFVPLIVERLGRWKDGRPAPAH